MRKLVLIRHAHAEKQPAGRDDYERRLDERGTQDAKHIAQQLAALKLSVDRLISSPAVRTQATARALLHALGLSRLQLGFEERIYDADRATLIEVLRHCEDSAKTIALIGHNPGISRLARWCCDADLMEEFVPGQAVVLTAQLEHWVDASKGGFLLQKTLKP